MVMIWQCHYINVSMPFKYVSASQAVNSFSLPSRAHPRSQIKGDCDFQKAVGYFSSCPYGYHTLGDLRRKFVCNRGDL